MQDALFCNLYIDIIAGFFRVNRFCIMEAFPQIAIAYFTLEVKKVINT